MYKLENITKKYKGFILSIDNLILEKGKIHVITGPNGCGKTTLMDILGFLILPDSGKIIYKGKQIDYADKKLLLNFRRETGHLLHNPYLFNMSVGDNISHVLSLRKTSKKVKRERTEEIMQILSLYNLKDRAVSGLSAGERQRVSLARILIQDSEVIVLDEPTCNIDKKNISVIENLIRELAEKGKTVIMTTHSLNQAYRMSSDIISMADGRIIECIHENVFQGYLREGDGSLKYMTIASGVDIAAATDITGNAYIAIDPEDIVISSGITETSARNTFRGLIKKIEQLKYNVRLCVDIGVDMVAVITKESYRELLLNLGSEVYITFKVNSVKVL